MFGFTLPVTGPSIARRNEESRFVAPEGTPIGVEHVAQTVQHHIVGKGFYHIHGCTRVEALVHHQNVATCGENDNRNGIKVGIVPQGGQDVVAVLPRHIEVGDDYGGF